MNNEHNAIEMENAILGYILFKKSMSKIYGFITVDDFYDEKNKIIFNVLNDLVSEVADRHLELSLITQSLQDKKLMDKIGGAAFLSKLINVACLESNISTYLKTIVEKANLRKLNKVLEKTISDLKTKADIKFVNVVNDLENNLFTFFRNNEIKGFEDAIESSKSAMDAIQRKLIGDQHTGLSSGYKSLDFFTSGFQKGDLIILAARPSMGKTALALNFAVNIAKKEKVAFFSVEMPTIQIFNRIFSMLGHISAEKIRNPKLLDARENQKLSIAESNAQKLKLFTDDTAGIRLNDLIWKAKTLHKNNPDLSLIIIDYLQLITTGENTRIDSRQSEVALISRKLKQLARELNIPIIALSQLSRRVEQRESKIPMMSDLRESGSIEQDADIVAFVYREEYYEKKKDDQNNQNQNIQIIIAKHRNGPTGIVNLSFEPKYGLFFNIENEMGK